RQPRRQPRRGRHRRAPLQLPQGPGQHHLDFLRRPCWNPLRTPLQERELKAQRGLTVVTVLVVLAVAGAIFWAVTYGEAYWDNLEVKHLVTQAANMSYRERDPVVVKKYIIRHLHDLFDEKVEDHGRIVTVTKIDFDDD